MSFAIKNCSNTILFDDELKKRFTEFHSYCPLYKKYFSQEDWSMFSLNYPVMLSSLASTDNYNLFDGKTKNGQNKKVFAKFCPLFDSTRYMIGKVSQDKISIPNPDSTSHHFSDGNNSAFVDSFFSYLTSQMLHQHGFVNGLDCYGSYLALYSNFRVDIQDELEYLFDSEYFLEHRNDFKVSDEIYEYFQPEQSCKYKKRLEISDEDISLSIDVLEPEYIPDISTNSFRSSDLVYIKENKSSKTSRSSSSSSSSTCSSRSSATTQEDINTENSFEVEDEEYSSCSSSDYEETPLYAYIKKFPVNMVLLESCKETLDEYMIKNKVDENEWSAILMQVIMSLILFQEKFLFIHNDLHNSNIMYIPTDKEYLYYKYNETYYKVPTYGKIWKLIDFGRAVYKFRGQIMFSDCFSEKGEASTQYNCEPYLNPKKKIVPPNFSFDLCRLACSMYDYFEEEEELPRIRQLISEWVKDDKGRNILYKNNGDERYPDFKLYKMITRTVHSHLPKNQLSNELFSQYSVSKKNIKKKQEIMKIDSIPSYTN